MNGNFKNCAMVSPIRKLKKAKENNNKRKYNKQK
jgi:hypothetical protein